jgi:hypothetical protein
MKTYRASRFYRWSRTGAKVVLTAAAGLFYVLAVTHPTPLAARLVLLGAITLLGWLFYVRQPRMVTEISVSDDGWVDFRSRKDTTRVRAADIRSIERGFARRSVQVEHTGGRLKLPNRFRDFFDFLLTVKGMNPAVDIRWS